MDTVSKTIESAKEQPRPIFVIHYEVVNGDTLDIKEAEFSPSSDRFNVFQEIEKFLIGLENMATKLVTSKEGTVTEFYFDPKDVGQDNLFHIFVIATDVAGLLHYYSLRDTDMIGSSQVQNLSCNSYAIMPIFMYT